MQFFISSKNKTFGKVKKILNAIKFHACFSKQFRFESEKLLCQGIEQSVPHSASCCADRRRPTGFRGRARPSPGAPSCRHPHHQADPATGPPWLLQLQVEYLLYISCRGLGSD